MDELNLELNKVKMFRRGEIWYVNLGKTVKRRPCLVVRNDDSKVGVEGCLDVEVLMLTHTPRPFPTVIPITNVMGDGDNLISYVDCAKPSSVLESLFDRYGYIGSISDQLMDEITELIVYSIHPKYPRPDYIIDKYRDFIQEKSNMFINNKAEREERRLDIKKASESNDEENRTVYIATPPVITPNKNIFSTLATIAKSSDEDETEEANDAIIADEPIPDTIPNLAIAASKIDTQYIKDFIKCMTDKGVKETARIYGISVSGAYLKRAKFIKELELRGLTANNKK